MFYVISFAFDEKKNQKSFSKWSIFEKFKLYVKIQIFGIFLLRNEFSKKH